MTVPTSNGRFAPVGRLAAVPVVAVVSPKGGNGKTTVSANLAVAMARHSELVLVDLDVHFGDIEYAFGFEPLYRLDDAVRHIEAGGGGELEHLLATHPTGVSALCAPNDPVAADRLGTRQVMAAVDAFIGMRLPVVLDTPGGISEYTLGALDRAGDVVLVCATDVPSVQACRKLLETMAQLSMDNRAVHLVVNRSTARCGLDVADVEAAVGMEAALAVPEHQSLAVGMNRGRPVTESDPGSTVAAGFGRFAAGLLGAEWESGGPIRRLLQVLR